MTAEMIQFAAIVLMTLLTLKLLTLNGRALKSDIINTSRWLMTVGTTLLLVQFTTQMTLGLRAMGITQGVMLNLLMFVPTSWVFSLSLLYLQRQGHLNKWDKFVGGFTWAIVIVLILGANIIDEKPLFSDTPQIRIAEKIASGCYIIMQIYYACRHVSNLRDMQLELLDYFDRDMSGRLTWMNVTLWALVALALLVPFGIFFTGKLIIGIALFFFFCIPYMVDRFCDYVKSGTPAKILEAERNAEEIMEERIQEKLSEELQVKDKSLINKTKEKRLRVSKAVASWLEQGGHLRQGITQPIAASEMSVPKYLFTEWLSEQNTNYNEWLAKLRIKEAQRILVAKPDWSNETIAEHCGFKNRAHFQNKFKEITGKTPTDWLNKQ